MSACWKLSCLLYIKKMVFSSAFKARTSSFLSVKFRVSKNCDQTPIRIYAPFSSLEQANTRPSLSIVIGEISLPLFRSRIKRQNTVSSDIWSSGESITQKLSPTPSKLDLYLPDQRILLQSMGPWISIFIGRLDAAEGCSRDSTRALMSAESFSPEASLETRQNIVAVVNMPFFVPTNDAQDQVGQKRALVAWVVGSRHTQSRSMGSNSFHTLKMLVSLVYSSMLFVILEIATTMSL